MHPEFLSSIPRLETERLLLRELTEADTEGVFQVFSDPLVTRYYDTDTFATLERAATLIAGFRRRFAEGTCMRWGIVRKSDQVLVGTCGFPGIVVRHHRAEIGFELGSAHWRQGIMSEAVREILRYAFEEVGFRRIEGLVMPGNEASVAILTRLGFTEEGLLRQYTFWKNLYWDLQMFALLNPQ